MTEVVSQGQNPYEAWTKLLESTMKSNPAMQQMTAEQGRAAEDDPWSTLINQLWKANPYSALIPMDPTEVNRAFQKIWLEALTDPTRMWENYNNFMQQYAQIITTNTLKFWGIDPVEEIKPVVEPEKGDKRFSVPDWQLNPVFDIIKQSYLLTSTSLLKSVSNFESLDDKQQRKITFYLRQFLDAISPTNSLFTNPQVIHETIQSGGQNLVKGMSNFMRDLKDGQIKMTDTEAFEPGRNLAMTAGKVVYRNKLIELLQYEPTTKKVYETPLLFIPPWINKYYILDMQPKNSIIKFLVDNGFTVYVISWKNPDASMEEISFDDYLTLGPLNAIEAIKAITKSPKVNTVGYCVGGTLLSTAMPYLAAQKDDSINSATFFVALQDFTEVGDTSVFIDEPQIAYMESKMAERGYLDSRSMSTMFNMLRANDLIWSNVVNNYLLGKEPPAFDLLYWNNDGTRMTRVAHSFYLRNTYLENNLIKPNKVVIKDIPIDLKTIKQDIYAVGAQQDHIVPWQSAWRISQLSGGSVRFALGGSGHIAGVINPPTKGRGYWINNKEAEAETADQWLEGAEHHDGSWWTDWLDWLQARSGEQVAPPTMGNAKYKPLMPAPGSYVLEK